MPIDPSIASLQFWRSIFFHTARRGGGEGASEQTATSWALFRRVSALFEFSFRTICREAGPFAFKGGRAFSSENVRRSRVARRKRCRMNGTLLEGHRLIDINPSACRGQSVSNAVRCGYEVPTPISLSMRIFVAVKLEELKAGYLFSNRALLGQSVFRPMVRG